MVNFVLPKGKDARQYKLVNKKGEVAVDGSLKEVKALFGIKKDGLVVKSFLKRVNKWATANDHTFTISGKSFEEAYPKQEEATK